METNVDHCQVNLEAGLPPPKKASFELGASVLYGLPLIIFAIFLIFFLACFLGPDPLLYLLKISSGSSHFNFGIWGYSESVLGLSSRSVVNS